MAHIVEIRPQCDECGYVLADVIETTKEESERGALDSGWIKRSGLLICDACEEKPRQSVPDLDEVFGEE